MVLGGGVRRFAVLANDLGTRGGGGSRARFLCATPLAAPPPPRVSKDSGAGSALNKCP